VGVPGVGEVVVEVVCDLAVAVGYVGHFGVMDQFDAVRVRGWGSESCSTRVFGRVL
jgi:hypothetical protein